MGEFLLEKKGEIVVGDMEVAREAVGNYIQVAGEVLGVNGGVRLHEVGSEFFCNLCVEGVVG